MSPRNYSETSAYRVLVEHSPRHSDELYMTMCGIEQCRADKEWESRVRDGFHLHAILSGCGRLETAKGSASLREGQLFLIKPGEKITYYPDPQNPWAYCWMSFGGARAGALMWEAGFAVTTEGTSRPSIPSMGMSRDFRTLVSILSLKIRTAFCGSRPCRTGYAAMI